MSDLVRLRQLSRWLYRLTIAAMGLCLLLCLFFALYPFTGAEVQALFPEFPVPAELPVSGRLAAFALGGIRALAILWTLDGMRRLFATYKSGEVLTDQAARLIRQIGQGTIAVGLLPLILRPLQGLALTWANPPGERVLSIGIGSSEFGIALAGGLLVVIGWAMGEAARAAEENRGFV